MLRYRSNEDVKLVLDDNDTSVTYSGNWGADSKSAEYFQVYGSTMHYTLPPNANASISFYGSYITVFGIIPSSSDLKSLGFSTTESQVESSYQFDDGPPELFNITLDASQHFTDQAFFQPSTSQSDGYHTLVITNLAGMLLLDYFTIVPATSNSDPNTYQKIDDTSPNIIYNNAKSLSTSRADFSSTLHSLRSSKRSTASLNFNGNFVAVYGALTIGKSLPNLLFTLDNIDQSDPSGSMPRLSGSGKQRLSQILFWKSSTLANGQHNLSITVIQGEFYLDFILIQTSDDAPGTETTFSSQSFNPSTPYVAPPSSTNTFPYGSTTSSGSASLSLPPARTSSDHTKNTSVIIGAVVEGVVGFVVLLLALYMIWILFKRKSGLRSKTQSNPEFVKASSQPAVEASLPVTTIAMAGNPDLVDGSGQLVTGHILRPSVGSVPAQRRFNSASLSSLPQNRTRLSLPANSQRMTGSTAACYIDNNCLPVRQSMLDAHRSSLPPALPPANRSSVGHHGPYQGYERTLVTRRPPLPPLPPANRSSTGYDPHPGYERTLYIQRSSLPSSLPRTNQLSTDHDPRGHILETQRPSLPPPANRSRTGHGSHQHQRYEYTPDTQPSSPLSLPPANRSSTGRSTHQGYEHTSDTPRPSPVPLLPPTYRQSTGHGGYEHTPDMQRPSLPPSIPPAYRLSTDHDTHQGYEHQTYRSSTDHDPHQEYEHTLDEQRPSLPPSPYRSSIGHGPRQGHEHTPDIHPPSLPPSLPPSYWSSARLMVKD